MSAATPIATRACTLTIALAALAPAGAHAARTPLNVQTENLQGQSSAATIATETPDVVALQGVGDLATLLGDLGDRGLSYLVGSATAGGEVILVANRDGLTFAPAGQGSGWAAIDGDVAGRPFHLVDADMPAEMPPLGDAGSAAIVAGSLDASLTTTFQDVSGTGILLTRDMARHARRVHDVDGGVIATVFP